MVCQTCHTNIVGWSAKNKAYSSYCCIRCAQQSPDVRRKTEETCLLRYGETTNLKSAETRNKSRLTCLEKYGVDNFAQTAQFRQQFMQTSLERYGVDNPSKSAGVKQLIDRTHQQRYGRKRQSQDHIPAQIIALKDDAELMRDLHITQQIPVYKIADMLEVSHSQLCVHFKNNLGIEPNKSYQVSQPEREIQSFLSELNVEFESSNRTVIYPSELDIYIKDRNLAIELDGLAWHSERRGRGKDYHLQKTRHCAEQGIRLIHIFDSEWKLKQEIVKSRLRVLLGQADRIFARHCQVRLLTANEYKEFFNQTHIQGSVSATVAIGLVNNGQIVAAMSFGRSRYNKNHQWELLRFSNALNTCVVGGAGRLFRHFVNTYSPDSVVSYSDLRWNTGNLYRQLGFEFTHSSGPNYWYTKDYLKLESRIKFQKHKLENLLEKFNPEITEWDNMMANGYDRVWDCGNNAYLWKADNLRKDK